MILVSHGNNRIVALSTDLAWKHSFGREGTGGGEFNGPVGIAEHSGALFIADTGNARMQVFEPGPTGCMRFMRSFGSRGDAPGQFDAPQGVAVVRGLLVVSEFYGRRLQVLTQTGVPLQALA